MVWTMHDLSKYDDDLKQLTESELGNYIYKQWNRFRDAQPDEDAAWLIGALRIRWQELHEDD